MSGGAGRAATCGLLSMLIPMITPAAAADVGRLQAVPPVTVSPGVVLKELTGRAVADPTARSDRTSVAWFHLAPGRASAWSHNRTGEESFFILSGHGEVRTGTGRQAVGPGDFILIPPSVVRSIMAADNESLTFYAVTSPAWSRQDDVLDAAPAPLRRARSP